MWVVCVADRHWGCTEAPDILDKVHYLCNHCFVWELADSSDGLEVKIPEQSPLRIALGSSLNIPCYFNIPEEEDTSALLTPRIKWSKLSNGTEVVLLVATGGKIRLNTEYREVVSLPNYPAIPTDATLEIKALRSNHTGIYRCEVMYGIEDRQDTIEVLVKGETLPLLFPPRIILGRREEEIYGQGGCCSPHKHQPFWSGLQ